MYTSNNQVIFEEIYDENIQPTEEEIIEYAIFIGIEPNEVYIEIILSVELIKLFYFDVIKSNFRNQN